MHYSAGMVSTLFWFNETKETIELINSGLSNEEILKKVVDENIYQLKNIDRRKRTCRCILKRISALPDEIISKFYKIDNSSAKILVLISIMKTDLLFFEFVYEVYRQKIILGEKFLEDKDLNLFFDYKYEQSEIVRKWSDSGIKKLKSCYVKLLKEAGLLSENNREVLRPLINYKIEEILKAKGLQVYLKAVKGEA